MPTKSAVASLPLGSVELGQNKTAEMPRAEFVINRTIRRLHLEQPVEFPFDFRQIIRQRTARLRDGKSDFTDLRAEVFPRAEHHTHGDAGVDNVFVVITRVVPAAGAVFVSVSAADKIQPGIVGVAGGVGKSFAVTRGADRGAASP